MVPTHRHGTLPVSPPDVGGGASCQVGMLSEGDEKHRNRNVEGGKDSPRVQGRSLNASCPPAYENKNRIKVEISTPATRPDSDP